MRGASGRAPALAVAATGGVLFAGALFYFLISYLWRFGARASEAPVVPIGVNIALFTVFALHHSMLARSGAKAWIQRVIPRELERSSYVWIASLLFLAVCYFWQPVAGLAWDVQGTLAVALRGAQAVGIVMTIVAARHLDVLDLAGVRQVLDERSLPAKLDQSGLYGVVRHPIYGAWLLIVWCAPEMNGTRLVFAAVSSAYLCIAVPFEERDLVRSFGAAYLDYQRRVRWRMVPFVY